MRIAMVRRQSPDWQGLARDFRRGLAIDPARYIPTSAVPGFPDRIDRLIAQWNQRFRIDFFTFRSVLAEQSCRNLAAVRGAALFDLDALPWALGTLLQRGGYCCFHDDDDFFAPQLADELARIEGMPDAVVTPLLRIGVPTFTFYRHGRLPAFVLGERRLHDFRYQTNNYALHVRQLASPKHIAVSKDHVLASDLADRSGFVDRLLPAVVSATVKTPGSAMVLPVIFRSERDLAEQFERFITEVPALDMPPAYGWIAAPLRRIVRLVRQVYAGADVGSIADLVPGSDEAATGSGEA